MRRLTVISALLLLGCSSALAVQPDCNDYGPGVHIKFKVHVGEPYTEEEQELFDKMHLRQNGIVARETRRTTRGCIEAFVSDGQGGFSTEYYDPREIEGRFGPDAFQLKFD